MITEQRFEIQLPDGRYIEMFPGSLLILLGMDLQTRRQHELAAGQLSVSTDVAKRVRLVVDHLAARFLKDAARAKLQLGDVEPRLNAMRAWIVNTVQWQPEQNDGNALREFVRIIGHGSEATRRKFADLNTFLRGCLGCETNQPGDESEESGEEDTDHTGPGRPPHSPMAKKMMIQIYKEWIAASKKMLKADFIRSKNFFGKSSPEKAISYLTMCGKHWRDSNGN